MLSSRLNPLGHRGVKVAALTLKSPLPHIKAIAGIGMLQQDYEKGCYAGKHTIVVDSSGNTAHAVALLAPAFGFTHVKLVMSPDVPDKKRMRLEELSWVQVVVVPSAEVAERARADGARPGCYHLNQYGHLGNPEWHYRYTGPEIVRAIGKKPGIVFVAMGSGGTAMGLGRYFGEHHPGTIVVGVRPALGDKVPGARDRDRMEEVVTLPWRDYIPPENVIDIPSDAAYKSMRKLAAEVLPAPGPTSGLTHAGFGEYMMRHKHRWPKGFVAAFICPDDAELYTE
ncbi:MAG: pyridoxal-phosphate dependent enzyme [Patescibacteria group bacterium]|nr:pyridoxal-phosphate dependent enzyme [Patescibacteria group bacterium]MDE1944319.1 pyridoxal-phosphate dependent enzyme [Patescibacteria group bacterium]MDE1945096.1 pyridoxal-phosphate dependent enzyme [Patescibacteria group bacterium]MDE2057606.1 pyridoxal-phosphate dependent enzyme [Patescibacteria group bacterium]